MQNIYYPMQNILCWNILINYQLRLEGPWYLNQVVLWMKFLKYGSCMQTILLEVSLTKQFSVYPMYNRQVFGVIVNILKNGKHPESFVYNDH